MFSMCDEVWVVVDCVKLFDPAPVMAVTNKSRRNWDIVAMIVYEILKENKKKIFLKLKLYNKLMAWCQ